MKSTKIGSRILILGCSGSGKSTFARKLRACTGLPLIHLDSVWWNADRTHISREAFDEALRHILAEEAWILDGDYSRTYEVRLRAAETVFFMDIPEEACMRGITERLGKERPDIPWTEACPDPELIEQVRHYCDEQRPMLLELFQRYPDKQVLTFHSRAEADAWLCAAFPDT